MDKLRIKNLITRLESTDYRIVNTLYLDDYLGIDLRQLTEIKNILNDKHKLVKYLRSLIKNL